VTLVFGYTACPDICPTAVQHWNEVFRSLSKADQTKARFVFVTVDPVRDTANRLAAYLEYFHPDFVGVHLEKKSIDGLLSELNTFARKVPSRSPGQYVMDHSAWTYLIDRSGRLVDELPFNVDFQTRRARLLQAIDKG